MPRGHSLVPRGRRYGSRYVASVLEVGGGGKSALVEYNDFNDEHVPDQLLRECASTCQPTAPSVHVSARARVSTCHLYLPPRVTLAATWQVGADQPAPPHPAPHSA